MGGVKAFQPIYMRMLSDFRRKNKTKQKAICLLPFESVAPDTNLLHLILLER